MLKQLVLTINTSMLINPFLIIIGQITNERKNAIIIIKDSYKSIYDSRST